MRNRNLLLLIILVVGAVWWILKEPTEKQEESVVETPVEETVPSPKTIVVKPSAKPIENKMESFPSVPKIVTKTVAPTKKEKAPANSLPYTMDDGLIVITHDIIIGEPVSPNAPETGYVEKPKIKLWPRIIPYHIQPNVTRPERITEALKLFENTSLQFVPYTNQNDVLVFDEREGNCKSYLGRVGGKQPIFLSPRCDASDIAHEIMHALGFIHEQNRTDRDHFVKILWENVEEAEKINFELFPDDLMVMSGGTPFDYHSIMIYDPQSFAKSPGTYTLQSLKPGQDIKPSPSLSSSDLSRIERVYGQ